MAKTVMIGAGSGFGKRMIVDLMSYPELQDGTLALVDINAAALEAVTEFGERVVELHEAPAKVEASTERREVLKGADYVIVAISVGGQAYSGEPYYSEVMIPKQYGVEQSVADTVGVGGVFRTLRTAPVMLDICRDMEELCPDALLINYTNPMAMLTWIMSEATGIDNVGLCHSVQGTAGQLAGYIGAPREEVTYWVAGINHMSWFLELEWKGQDAYPLLNEAMEDPEVYAKDPVRFEIMRHFDYFVTESTRHMSEYVPYFRKRPELLEEFNLPTREPAKEAKAGRWEWQDEKDRVEQLENINLKPSGEYASHIIQAIETGEPFRFNGNVMNEGIIGNLPAGCCVEVPCLTDASGINPCHVGELPPQLAALNAANVAVQELTVWAVLERDLHPAYQACLLDPLTASVCSLAEIRSMFDELVQAEGELLGYYA
ncbi:MAG: alpha-galactosidase [Armatimonadota bacterium]